MKMEDAWRPVDEVVGTAVDTLIYGVCRDDGMYYDTKVGKMFCETSRPVKSAHYWRAYKCMKSLVDRGLDPLSLLANRAHSKGMEFLASLRMASTEAIDPPGATFPASGAGLSDAGFREQQMKVIREMASYDVEGVELDFAAYPSGMQPFLPPGQESKYVDVLTEQVRQASRAVRERNARPGLVGARVYVTEEMNLRHGMDVRAWLKEGLLDYVVPMLYIYADFDINMPIDWIIGPAHEADVSVYGFMQHYARSTFSGAPINVYPTTEMARAVIANHWDRGVDGIYTHALHWPFGSLECSILTEMGDPEIVREADKRYFLNKRTEKGAEMGYPAPLPVTLSSAALGTPHEIRFRIADDVEGNSKQVRLVKLKVLVTNLLAADTIRFKLSGKPLDDEHVTSYHGGGVSLRDFRSTIQEFNLGSVRPKKGDNVLTVSLDSRPEDMAGDATVEEVEVIIEYTPFPSGI
ncbi:MAG: hypothetical protein FJ319_04875 [SAR202 cluster bacterium]|nr:hypothetical protein [SAR202 cluster bacterium]